MSPKLSVRKKALDALGAPIDPTATYEAITSFIRGHRVFNQGYTLRGDDPDVLAAPALWVRESATSLEKREARVAHVARRRGDVPEPPPDLTRPRILGPIPPGRRMRAVREYHDRSGRMILVGDLADANDEFVQRNPDLFVPDAA